MRSLLSAPALFALSAPALANTVGTVPEPESIALIAVAAVGALVAFRRKKK
jgi:hypothetical protein